MTKLETGRHWVRGVWRRRDRDGAGSPPSDVWVTWFDRLHVVSGGLGVVAVAVVLVGGEGDVWQRIVGASLAVGMGLLTWWWMFRQQTTFFASSWQPVAYLAIALPVVVALGSLDSIFQIFLFLAYWQVFSLLPLGWSIITASLLTIANLWAQQGFDRDVPIHSSQGWALFFGVLFMSGLMAAFISSIVHQSNQRRNLVNQLTATRAQLASSEREAGMVQERQRLAGEVHDTIAQDFTSLVMHLEAAEVRLAPGSAASSHIAMAKEAARQGLSQSRQLVYALRPDLLASGSLVTALRTQVSRWSRETGVESTFALTGEPFNLDRDVEVAVFRALQESLANVQRHAGATRVNVTMSYLGDEAMLDVRDNGCGFDASQPGAGVGLQTMRERVALADGTVSVESECGEGAIVTVSIPMGKGTSS